MASTNTVTRLICFASFDETSAFTPTILLKN